MLFVWSSATRPAARVGLLPSKIYRRDRRLADFPNESQAGS